MFRRPLAMLGYALPSLLLLIVAAPVLAQKQQHIRMEGKVKASGVDQVTLEGEMGMDVVVRVSKGAKVSIEGTAVREYLGPGVNVEFVADATAAGTIPKPITEITVCSLTTTHQPTFSPHDPTLPTLKGKDALNQYDVCGTIKFFRKDELQITIPGKAGAPAVAGGRPTPPTPAKTIKATLAPDAKIKVLVTDTSWAQPGDEVSVQGTPVADGDIRARSLKITLAKPVEPKEDPKGKKSASK